MAYEQLELRHQLCFRLYTASRLITQAYEPYLKPLGITYTQYLVLLVLWEKDNQPVNDIGKKLLLGIHTTSPLIKRMEVLGLVARHGNDADKRQQLVYLTPKGKQMKEDAANIPNCLAKQMLESGVAPEEMFKLIPLLDEFISKMIAKEKQDTVE